MRCGGACVERRPAIEVFFDGECRLCRASRDWAERRDPDGRLAFRDLNDPVAAASLPVPHENLREEMWVRLPGGTLASGFSGWLAVLRVLPRWRLVAAIIALPPLRWVGPIIYRIVARHRQLLPRR